MPPCRRFRYRARGSPVGSWWPFGRMILEVRLDMPAWKQAVAVACSILIGMFISAVILVACGVPPSQLVNEFASNVFDAQSLHAVLVQAAPLILVGIAASIGFRARFWNLGLEGQMVWGGIAATAVSIYHVGPEALRLPLMALFAMLAGMAWVAIPALLRLKFAVNEIISTLLLNYVATYCLYDLLYGPWKDLERTAFRTRRFTRTPSVCRISATASTRRCRSPLSW